MQLTFAALVLATITFDITFAQPHHRVHKRLHRLDLAAVLKQKRQNWNDPSLYKGVDWNKVNYGNAGAAAPAPATKPASTPAPAPAPAAVAQPASSPSPVAAAAAPVVNSNTGSGAPPVTNSNSGSGKRGLAFDPTSPSLNIFDGYSKITWGYNWSPTPTLPNGVSLPSNFQFVPMLFSNSQDMNAWANAVTAATSGSGTHYLLAFNEPDMATKDGGSAMDVGLAVTTYQQYMSKHSSANVKLGAPAVSSSNNPGQGLDGWLKPFLQACTGCIIDFIPVHWYGSDPNEFKSHLQSAMSYAGGKPIWVTEFQCQGGDESAFLAQVLPWMDSQAGIARYSYFMASSKSLTSGNALSAVGSKYVSA